MTAKELHERDPGFRGFLAVWEADRRCPLPLVDYLLDRGMDPQAECARWAATEPDRRPAVGQKRAVVGVFPAMIDNGYAWFVFRSLKLWEDEYSHWVRSGMLSVSPDIDYFPSRSARSIDPKIAILHLMDAWVVQEVFA